MKAIVKILAVVVAASSIFTLSGCAGRTVSAKMPTLANWNIRNSGSVESGYAPYWQTNAEVATYSVSFTAGNNSRFSVRYDEGGTYTTTFYMQAEYDWNSSDIPEAYRSAQFAAESVYVYETELTLSGEYTLTATGESAPFEDSIKTTTKFRLAEGNLQPVYSVHDIHSTSPAELSPADKEGMTAVTQGVYTTYYNHDCTQATVTAEEEGRQATTDTFDLVGKEGYSLFENFQLRIAARAIAKDAGAGYLFDVFNPEDGKVSKVQASCGGAVSLDGAQADQKGIIDALDAASPYIFVDSGKDEEGNARTYRYNSVTLSLATSMRGQSDVLWYAAVENSDANAARSVLLRVSSPLAFGLGTLTYNLSSITTKTI